MYQEWGREGVTFTDHLYLSSFPKSSSKGARNCIWAGPKVEMEVNWRQIGYKNGLKFLFSWFDFEIGVVNVVLLRFWAHLAASIDIVILSPVGDEKSIDFFCNSLPRDKLLTFNFISDAR